MRLSAVLVPLALVGLATTNGGGAHKPPPPPPPSTTLASWSMSETTSQTTMADSSGNKNNGAISSQVLRGQPGFSGTAYGFAGDGGRVTVPNAPSLNPGSGPYEVSLYFKSSVKPSSSVGDYDLIRKGLSSTSGGDWKIEVLHNGHASCHFRGSSGSVNLTGTSNVVTGGWHNIMCSTTSTGTTLLVDGASQATSSARPGPIVNSANLLVGAKNASEDSTTGTLDEITISRPTP